MRATAQIREAALRISRDCTILQLADQLSLINLATITEHLHGVSFRNILTFDLLFLSDQFRHLSLNRGEIALLDHGLTRIYIIIETIFNCRADTELDTRIQLLQSLRHQVRA